MEWKMGGFKEISLESIFSWHGSLHLETLLYHFHCEFMQAELPSSIRRKVGLVRIFSTCLCDSDVNSRNVLDSLCGTEGECSCLE